MNIRYRVELSQCERDALKALITRGKHSTRKLTRARILLAADEGLCDDEIIACTRSSGSTVTRVKRRFVEGNLENALDEHMRPGRPSQTDGQARSSFDRDVLFDASQGAVPLDIGAFGCRTGTPDRP